MLLKYGKFPIVSTVSVVNKLTGETLVVDVIEAEMSYYVQLSEEADAKHSPRLEHQLNTESSANNAHKGMKKIDELIEYKVIWMRSKDETLALSQ